ncbi:LysR substrate-binding domain-containing protein [Pseudonocardia sp. NPDC046786]|uniref:LysR substrate-binding domain-containing protein n=1 Tax=Pseudonocardia sp. NPDC046786 TaxID=3155471 RepID=UPI0033D445FD
MSDPLDLAQLRTIVTIADVGGFHRAAASLHLSQATVSQHVRQLERRLGQQLVVKAGRGTRFTAEGEQLLVEARRLLAASEEMLERLGAAAPGQIVVGATEQAADQILPGLLRAVDAAFPGRDVRFRLDRSRQLTEAVAAGTIDVAVVLGSSAAVTGIEVGSLPLQWYSAPSFRLPVSDGPWPLVAFDEPCGMRARASATLAELGHAISVRAESTTLEGVLAAVRAGLGLTVLPGLGRVPEGTQICADLPSPGRTGVRIATRRGLVPAVEAAARTAVTEFLNELGSGSSRAA